MASTLIQAICKDNNWRETDAGVEIILDGGRTQLVSRATFTESGEEHLRLASIIGPADKLDDQRMRAALRLNANMRFGAFAILGQDFAVVDTFLLSEADQAEVRDSLLFLAQTADRYEQIVFGTDEN